MENEILTKPESSLANNNSLNGETCRSNIWLINHYATGMYKDLGGRHFSFAQKLFERGYRASVICASTVHNSDDTVETGKERFSVKMAERIPFVFVKSTPYETNSFDRIKNMFTFARNVIKLKRKLPRYIGKPDVIIASSVHPLTCVAGLKLGRFFKVPVIVEIRDLWPEAIFYFEIIRSTSLVGKILTVGERWIYMRADAIIFTKEGDVDYLKEMGWDSEQGGDIDLNKCFYINNGVDLDRFDLQVLENRFADGDLDDDTFKVIYTGSIRQVNSVDQILDCAALLKKFPEIRFLVYGDGDQLEHLIKRVKEEQLHNTVLKGFVEKKYIPYILSNSSVNLLNYSQSKYNWSRGNSSNKLFEYMASAKPIISTIKMGYSLIERYNCGVELDHPSPKKLAQTILGIYHSSDKDYSDMCRNARMAASDFDFSVLSEKLINVIDFVLDRHGRGEE